MASKKIKTKDILGENYYKYNLSSSNYSPSLNSSITITCVVKNVYGDVISNKSLQLKQNGINVGNSVSTNSNGVATWTVTCSNGGLQEFSIEDNLLEVFVDNKADANHTHNNYLTSHQDLSNYVQKSQTNGLIKNDGTIDTNTYLTSHQDITGKEDKSNKVTSWTPTTSDTNYPSEKLVKDSLNDVTNTIGSAINSYANSVATTYQTKQMGGGGKNYQNKNVVTDSSGNITVEAKPIIPSASSTTPSADTTNGVTGSSEDYARADHQHPLSSAYAEASHTHNNYLTSHQDISGKEDTSNKVTSLSSSSTNTQYPSAKVVYDNLNNHTHEITDLENIDTVQVVVTYTDDSTETLSLLSLPKHSLIINMANMEGYFITSPGVQLQKGEILNSNDNVIESVNYDSSNKQFKFDNVPYGEYRLKIFVTSGSNSNTSNTRMFVYNSNNFEYNIEDIIIL